jgi:hypothetical protein
MSRLAELSLAVICGLSASAFADASLSEYAVKAAFVYQFTNFVDWPPGTFAGVEDPAILCIVANAEGVEAFSATPSTTPNHRPIRMLYFTDTIPPEALKQCHLLFVGESYARLMAPLAATADSLPILTIFDDGTEGMISFFKLGDHIRFKVDLSRIREAKFRISSQVLKIAADVKD